MIVEHKMEIRVRYHETDGQGRVHHAQYLNYFERGRVELMRSIGHSYREFEATGLMLVVSEMQVRYLGAAEFDDLLTLSTQVVRSRRVRIEHCYELTRHDPASGKSQMVVQGSSTIACVGRDGKVQPLPDYLRTA